jgi:hypothetical protein
MTPGRRVYGAWYIPFQNCMVKIYRWICYRDSINKCPGIGMKRSFKKFFHRAGLDNTSQVHNSNPITDMLNNTQVMGNK